MRRQCLALGCTTLTEGSRCPVHRRRQARGYGAEHDRARRILVAALPLRCAYCGELVMTPGDLAAAHVIDGDPTAGWQAAHRLCNERAKQR